MIIMRICCKNDIVQLHHAHALQLKLAKEYPEYDVVIETINHNTILNNIKPTDSIYIYEATQISAAHVLTHNGFAIYEKGQAANMLICNTNIQQQLAAGQPIRIAYANLNSVPTVQRFLQKALPQYNNAIQIEFVPIDEDYTTYISNMLVHNVQGIIMPVHYVELYSQKQIAIANTTFDVWLVQQKIMVLPALECTPAFGQGTYVLEVNPHDAKTMAILQTLHNGSLLAQVKQEATLVNQFQHTNACKANSFSFVAKERMYSYINGIIANGNTVEYWAGLPILEQPAQLFSSAAYMKGFFSYAWHSNTVRINTPSVFVANYKALTKHENHVALQEKKIFVSGTRTWFEMARQQYWVMASADALGFEYFIQHTSKLLMHNAAHEICIITNNASAKLWQQKGYKAFGNYDLESNNDADIIHALSNASHIFWTSFKQFEYYNTYTNASAIHICVGGETATGISSTGVTPIIFPTIKAFLYWQQRIMYKS
jgi:hypothetical protein